MPKRKPKLTAVTISEIPELIETMCAFWEIA